MAISNAQARQAAAEFADEVFVRASTTATVGIDDLQAAGAAADAWLDANVASFNAALPLPFRMAATTQQKAALLIYVARRRAGL
jgi:hypothetical protein